MHRLGHRKQIADFSPKQIGPQILVHTIWAADFSPKDWAAFRDSRTEPEIPILSRNSRKLGFPKNWFGIGIEFGIPENFGLGIGTRVSVWDPIPNDLLASGLKL